MSEWERLMRKLCEVLTGGPVDEQAPEPVDIVLGIQSHVDRISGERSAARKELGACHSERISLATRCTYLRESLDDARAIIDDLRKGRP